MSKSLHVLTGCSRIAAGVMIAATWASAQPSTVVFQGLTHTAVGGATLRVDPVRDTLRVNTFDPAGEDGVAVELREATSWTARLEATAYSALPLNLTWHALADGQRISTATMRQSGDNFDVSVRFTGAITSTYSAYVYNGGRLVGALGSLPPSARVRVGSGVCGIPEFAPLFDCRLVLKFRNSPNGECSVELEWDRPVAVRLPNGVTLTGNELRLMEEVRPAGHYPYLSFDSMVIQSNASNLTLVSESVR